jgi:phosphatidylserine decarboxylase
MTPSDGQGMRGSVVAVLAAQILVLAFCLYAVSELLLHFPFPSPLVKPLLPPKLRWPAPQVEHWIETGHPDEGFLDFFSRDPERKVPAGANLVSAADGRVTNIAQANGVTYLVVGLSYWDVHVVRTPIAGVVTSIEQEGTYFTRHASPKELHENIFLRGKAAPVQQIVTLATSQGEVRVRLITSYWASRLKVWVHEGERLEKGERIGRILLGSTVVVELPGNRALPVHLGQSVVGGESIIFEGNLR